MCEVTWCLKYFKYFSSSPVSLKAGGEMCQDQRNVDGYMVIHYPGLYFCACVKLKGVGLRRRGGKIKSPSPLLALMCLFPRVEKMAPNCSRLPFQHLLSWQPHGKRMSPFPAVIPTEVQGLIVSDWPKKTLEPISQPITMAKDCSVLTGSGGSCPLGLRMEPGGSLKGK